MQPQDSIHVHNITEAVAARRKLCRAIFGTPHVPREMPATFADQPSPVNGLPNGQRLTLAGCADTFRWMPVGWNGTLVIVHQGHVATLTAIGVDTLIAELFAAGYAVVGCLMPDLAHHDGSIPLANFLRPVHAAINHAFATLPTLKKVCMTGLSGGGWTTTLCAALDRRIVRSIPVAGSLPLYMTGARDWEQTWIAGTGYSYLDLYILAASHARTQVQVLHTADGVFDFSWYVTGPDYVDAVRAIATGEWDQVWLSQTQHEYLAADRAIVQTEIAA